MHFLVYRLHQWLNKKHKKKEIHSSFYNEEWYYFTCLVRWNDEAQEIEFCGPSLIEVSRYKMPSRYNKDEGNKLE